MFRIGLKFPCYSLKRSCKVTKYSCSRWYLTRFYETQTNSKCNPDKTKKHYGAVITFGAITLGAVGVLTYAKQNTKFREALEGWIPGSDHTIRIIFQEDDTYIDLVCRFFEKLKLSIINVFFGEQKKKESQTSEPGLDGLRLDYTPPKPAFVPLIDKKTPPINEPYSEIRFSKEGSEEIEVVAEKPFTADNKLDALVPSNLVELEKYCGEAASRAISNFHKATCAIHDYNQDVIKVVESSASTVGGQIWERLKAATEKRKEALKEAENNASDAVTSLRRMYDLIDDPKFDAPLVMKTTARRNINKILDDVDDSKKKFEKEQESANIAERYWKQVKGARENFNEELQILFPNININDKKLSVNEDALDLFVLHVYHKIAYLQKELEKQQTVGEMKIKTALKAVGDEGFQAKIDAAADIASARERRCLQHEFDKVLLKEKKSFEEAMHKQLQLQSRVHTDHLQEVLDAKESETQRLVERAISEQTEGESIKYKTQLAALIGKLRGLDEALKLRLNQEKGACDAQMLWAACQALARAVKVAMPGTTSDKPVRPLEPEIIAVSKAAPKDDALVRAAIEGIPEEASRRGVFPEDALRERFLKVEHMAKRLALVPEEGASLPIYLLSYLQSFLLVQATSPIPKKELEDKPIEVESLNTYDILQRARYYLDRGDFKMTLRYMNLLKGASRCVARDWMNEARILLETQQAVDTLTAYAGASGLVFLGCNSK